MILAYEAIDAEGRPTTDTVEAADSQGAVELLRQRGLYVTHMAKASASPDTATADHGLSESVRLPMKLLVVVTRQIAMLLRAGSSVVPALTAIKRQMRKPPHVALFGKIIVDLEEGLSLTDALQKHPRTFGPVYCAVVAAGEASATLTEMFERLANIVRKRSAMQKKIIGALAYPMLLTLMSSQILLALLFFVIPRFSDMFVQLGVDPPATTKILLSTGQLLAGYWPVILGAVVMFSLAGVVLLRSARGKQWVSDVQLCIPIVGGLRTQLIQGQILRTMGMLLESRVGILDTLCLVRPSTRNNRFRKFFDDMEETVTSGGSVADVFERSGLIEPHIGQAIRTGEESGSLGSAMTYCADMLDENNGEVIDVIMRLIEPIILIGMGLVVGGVAVSLFLPLFDLTSAIH